MGHLPGSGASEILARVGVRDQMRKAVSKLSPPARRRVAFARVLLSKPPVILLDRPILRTDLDTQALFARLISQAASEGAAVLLTDEDLSWAGKCCMRVVELEAGRITGTYMPGVDRGPSAPERLIPYKIPARNEARIVLYDPGGILYATSRDGQPFLRTATEEATTNLTLQELETRLAGRGFFKDHRAYLVNLQHINSEIQYTHNSYTLQLSDRHATLIPLSTHAHH